MQRYADWKSIALRYQMEVSNTGEGFDPADGFLAAGWGLFSGLLVELQFRQMPVKSIVSQV